MRAEVKAGLWLLCVLLGLWLLVCAPVGLMFGLAVMEALVLAVAGVGLVLLAGVLLLDDVLGPRR